MTNLLSRLALVAVLVLATAASVLMAAEDRIRPYRENPFYWEYQGRPIILVGGSVEDNLFQIGNLESHLDRLQSAGGNYVRNTLSSRDPGDVWAFERDPKSGQYDLTRFNGEYWRRLEALLDGARRRGIIVQIEVWATFDFYDGREMRSPVWQVNPFNPRNNLNYSADESGLPEVVPCHPTGVCNPFFRAVPALDDNRVVYRFQKAFVDRLLEIALPFPNVLYCMNNETKVSPEWGRHWAAYIRERGVAVGREVWVTDMFDPWDLSDLHHRETLDRPELYGFIEISQNNHQQGPAHWENAQIHRRRVLAAGPPRPLSNVKIYGADSGRYGTTQDAVERFWRNIVGGMASARFHRPPSGIGLSDLALTQIRSMRMFLDRYNVAQAVPDACLDAAEGRYAYASKIDGVAWAVYFPTGGTLTLTTGWQVGARVQWLNINQGRWTDARPVTDPGSLELTAPGPGAYLALIEAVHFPAGAGAAR